jgi:hypothetical protein
MNMVIDAEADQILRAVNPLRADGDEADHRLLRTMAECAPTPGLIKQMVTRAGVPELRPGKLGDTATG